MHRSQDDSLGGRFAARSETSELLPNLGRRLCRALGRLAIVGLLVTAGAVIFTGDVKEPDRDASQAIAAIEPALEVEAVAFSPDGQTVACCGWDTAVCLWDVSGQGGSRSREPVYLNHDSQRLALAFSPDGRYLATSGKGSLAVWSCESGSYEPVFEQTGLTFRCLAFARDGRTLALGGDDGAIRLWEVAHWRERAVLLGHKGAVRCVAFAPDSHRLVSSGQDRMVMLWDADQGVAVRQLGQPGPDPVQLAAFSPDGKTVAIAEKSGSLPDISLVDPETGVVRAELSGHPEGIDSMAFSPDGQMLATAGTDGRIRLWNLADGKPRTTNFQNVGRVKAMAFSPNGAELAFADIGANLRLVDLKPKAARLSGRELTKDASHRRSTPRRPIDS
jgi:WD40 repeat protein